MSEDQKVLFVEWCAADALGGMVQMAPMTELAYRRIIDMIYSTNDELLDDDNVLPYSTKTGSKWKAIKKELIDVHKKIYVENGKIRNEKCTEKLEKVWQKLAQSSHAGKMSAEKRKALKNKEAGSTDVEIPLGENVNETPTNQEPNNQVRKNTHTPATTPRDSGVCDFSDFWRERPGRGRHADPAGGAEREWRKLVDAGEKPEDLLDAVRRWAKQVRAERAAGSNERYAKTAENFLSSGLWRQYAAAGPESDGPEPTPLPPIPDWQQPLVPLIGEQNVRTWLIGASLEGKILTVKTKFFADWVKAHFDQAMRQCFGDIEVVFENKKGNP